MSIGTPAISPDTITVMLVDDSAIIRGALTRLIEADASIKITASKINGLQAVESIAQVKPDVVVLDIEMPVMDGLTALPKLQANCPTAKIFVCSTMTEKGAAITMKALSLGAVECVLKPQAGAAGMNNEFQSKIIALIKKLAPAHKRDKARKSSPIISDKPVTIGVYQKPVMNRDAAGAIKLRANATGVYQGIPKVVAIGSSTGGPQALSAVLPHLRQFPIPIFITQHMPPTFTRILAQHLSQQTGIQCHEAADNMTVQSGHVYIAPGNFHMKITGNENNLSIKLWDGPQINFCKPAVDPMIETLISIFGNKVLGVILTGMGHDGIGGGRKLAELGGRLIAQDEKTSVVWGMPGAVANEGLCTEVLPIDEIGPRIKRIVTMR